jgi:integrase
MPHERKIGKPVIKTRGAGFQARVRVGGLGGKPKDFYGHGPTEHEAVAAAVKQAHAFDPGLVAVNGNISFIEYLRDFHRTNDKLKPRTRATYMDRIAHHVAPVLKDTPVDRLQWGDFQRLKNTMAAKGAGANTILGVFRMLNKPIEIALRRKMLKENPLLTISLPAGVSAPRTPLTHAQLLHLLDLSEGSYWADHLHVLATTGMRVAELLGLEWKDVRFDGPDPSVTVRQQAHDARYGVDARMGAPKTKSSGREIALPVETAERLRRRWERWLQPGPDRLVFPNAKGAIQDPSSLRHFLQSKAKEIGVTKLHPHLLRHTMISHALQITGDLGGVSAMAGHSNPRVTAGVYLKGLPGAGKGIAKAMGTLISRGRD